MSDLFWLTDEQMERLQPFFTKSHGKPRVDDRRVLSGIVFVNKNGLRWRDAPVSYGPHDDASIVFNYTHVLFAFRDGKPGVSDLVAQAVCANRHLPAILARWKRGRSSIDGMLTVGGGARGDLVRPPGRRCMAHDRWCRGPTGQTCRGRAAGAEMVMRLPAGVSFAKRTIVTGRWTYDLHHDRLGVIGRIVQTALPDNANTHISCEIAENPNLALTGRRRDMFEPLALEISDRLEQVFAHRIDGRS